MKTGKNFMRSFLAMAFTLWAMGYLTGITFFVIPEANKRTVDTISVFVMGTVVAALISYYYGTSQSSTEKNELLRDSTPINPATTSSSIKVETHVAENAEEKKP